MPELTPYEHRGTCNAGLSHIGPQGVIYRPEGLSFWTLNLTISGCGYFVLPELRFSRGIAYWCHHGSITNMALYHSTSDHWDHYWATFPSHPIVADLLHWPQAKQHGMIIVLPSGPVFSALSAGLHATLVERADEAWPMRDELCLSQLRVILSWMNPNGQSALQKLAPTAGFG